MLHTGAKNKISLALNAAKISLLVLHLRIEFFLRLWYIYHCEGEKTKKWAVWRGDGDGRSQGLAVSLFSKARGMGGGGAHLCYEKETSQKPERTDGGGRLSAR